MSSCIMPRCGLVPMPGSSYCNVHWYSHAPQPQPQHNEDEIIVPTEDDVDEELLTSAFKLSAADVLRKAKKQGFVTPTSEYVGVPAA